jgi:hypothetical protein
MRSDLTSTQRHFTEHLRDPRAASCPEDVPPRRMRAYRELLVNNVESAVDACFPVLRGLVGAPRWHGLVEKFFAHGRCQSPIYREIPAEFLAWLKTAPSPDLFADVPFLLELAHYEWMELALDIDPAEIPETGIDPRGDLLAGVPVLNPLARLLTYRFPVHRIGADFRPAAPDPDPTRLVMVRRRDYGIGFLEVNPLVARLIELLGDNRDQRGAGLLDTLQREFPAIPARAFQEGGVAALHELAVREVVLGTRTPADPGHEHGGLR